MSDANSLLLLRIALIVIGLTFIFGIYTLGIVWPSGWAWGQGMSGGREKRFRKLPQLC